MNITVEKPAYPDSTSIALSYASLASIPVSVIGLVANLFMLYLFVVDRDFYKSTYQVLRVSVVSDIICTITTLVGYLLIAIRGLDYYSGTTMCRLVFYIGFSSYGVSIMNLCLIGIDRYFNIKGLPPVCHRHKRSILFLAELVIVILALLVTSPTLVYVKVHHNDTLLCDFPVVTPSISIYLISFALIEFFIPSILIVIIYWKIFTLQKNIIRPNCQLERFREEESLSRKRFIKKLLSISISYILITWPFFISLLILAITRQSLMDIRRKNIIHFLILFSSVAVTISIAILNPFIYMKFDRLIRSKAIMLFQRFLPDGWIQPRRIINYNSAISNSYNVRIEPTLPVQ